MTKSIANSSISHTNKNGGTLGLLNFDFDKSERDEIEDLQSRISVARALLLERVRKGFTQEELGKAAGSKQSRISEIEALRGNPRFDTLDKIARVLGLMITLVPRAATASPTETISGYAMTWSETVCVQSSPSLIFSAPIKEFGT